MYFPKKVLWRAFLCSLIAAIVLKALNPTGTGKLVLFETDYGTSYRAIHYLVFVTLGLVGGLFGGTFCKANFAWSKSFRSLTIIKSHPMLEVFLVVLATVLLQYPNPLTREPGDIIIKKLLVDCRSSKSSWLCREEGSNDRRGYAGWLAYGTVVKLALTSVTFGCKVPSGIIIPALDAGALFGRLVGLCIHDISPGIFAMVGAAAFLAGVSRMTISLAVIMFELTGELEYVVPNMLAIMVAKWVADALERDGVYDLAQSVLGHPFLELDHAMTLAKREAALANVLIPTKQTMTEITVETNGLTPRTLLEEKLRRLRDRGLLDAGLVLVRKGMLQGYLPQGELEYGLGVDLREDIELLGEGGLSMFVDRTPLTVCSTAPMEYVVEMFGKLGLRYLCVVEEGTSRLVGVILKKRLLMWLESVRA
jgi:chloride channel 3/4/5